MKVALTAVMCLGLAFAGPAWAHDTDQFSVPVGEQMADLGPLLSARYGAALRRGVEDVNERIRRAKGDLEHYRPVVRRSGNRPSTQHVNRQQDPRRVIARAQSPEGLAQSVYQAFGPAVDQIEKLERELHGKNMAEQYPGMIPAYKAKSDWDSIYNKAYSPIDPRNISAIFHASTIKMFGVHLGTDKLGHFADMGYHYYKTYRNKIDDGRTEDEAMAAAVKIGTDGIFSERGLLGYLTAGSYSNADLVSNYTGCLFYRNLTESITIDGETYDPIVVRDGEYWKVNDGFDDATFMNRYITDHWNEALNPSLYEPLMRGTVRKLVRERNEDLLTFYRDRYGDHDPGDYFTDLSHELRTFYGDDYGHHGDDDNLIHIGNTIAEDE